jgi:hypothetical protein
LRPAFAGSSEAATTGFGVPDNSLDLSMVAAPEVRSITLVELVSADTLS